MKRKNPPTYLLNSDFGEKSRKYHREFLDMSRRHFGTEMTRVADYVAECRRNPIQKDFTWATYPEEFYYAELTAITTLNSGLWDDFCRAQHTIVFIPDCLSLMQDKCKRAGEPYLELCDQCVPNCAVNKIAALKEKYEFREVFAYRDQTEQFKILIEKYKSVSFLGIACILMLADGMRTSMTNGVPAHGVPLQCCGCEHWARQPFPTDTDIAEIERVLRLKAEYRSSRT